MTPPFRPPPLAVPRGCGGDRCASGRDAWPLHHVSHDGVFCRLCSSCVLLYHPAAFCSACLFLLPPSSASARVDPVLSPLPGPTADCSICGFFVAHQSCVPDPASFRAARILLIAARLAHDSVARAAAAARQDAERCVREAAAARKRSREMLDAAFRALEAEATQSREVKKPKKKTPKSSEANRDRDKLLKLNAMKQPALAFAAAAAAAAASSMPLSIPSSREDKKLEKQQTQGDLERIKVRQTDH
uniref:Uncharacterized protein n=1 Tax=Leersia perrieri TaxID=77586 RepID=A0A0D9WEL1_9ORYZ